MTESARAKTVITQAPQRDATPFFIHETAFTLKGMFEALRNSIIAGAIIVLGLWPQDNWSIGIHRPGHGHSQALAWALIGFGFVLFTLNIVQSLWQLHSVFKKMNVLDRGDESFIPMVAQFILALITPMIIIFIAGLGFIRR